MPDEDQISLSVFQMRSAVVCHENAFALSNPFSFKDVRKTSFVKTSQIALDKLSCRAKSNINPPPLTTSHNAPRFETTTGTPQAIASNAGRPNPSSKEGRTNNVAPAYSPGRCSSAA